MDNNTVDYINSGGFLLLSLSVSFINIYNIDFCKIVSLIEYIESIDITIGALGLLVLLSVSYPLGYLINTASYQVLGPLRRKVYLRFNTRLPTHLKSNLESIYEYRNEEGRLRKIPMDDLRNLYNEGIYINLIRIHLITLCADSYRQGNSIWRKRLRFFRLFSTSCLFSLTLLVVSLCLSLGIYPSNIRDDIFSYITLGMISTFFILCTLNTYLYYRYLSLECTAFLSRYLTVLKSS